MDHHNLAVAYQNREHWIRIPNMKLQDELVLEGGNVSPTHASNTEVHDTSGNFLFLFWWILFKQKQGHAMQTAAE